MDVLVNPKTIDEVKRIRQKNAYEEIKRLFNLYRMNDLTPKLRKAVMEQLSHTYDYDHWHIVVKQLFGIYERHNWRVILRFE